MVADNKNHQINLIQLELIRAEKARSQGNEGMARVCSRRAAGIAIGEYLSRQGYTNFSSSAYERLIILKSLPNISSKALIATENLLLRVNEDHELPIDIDLINETRWLVHYLLPEFEN